MSDQSLSGSVGNFAELVAAGTPTPGGGSVSAYCGVLAASLGQMVCSITISKPKYAAVEPGLTEIKSELKRLASRLRELVAEDAASFEAVLRAYRLPKETTEQKAERAVLIQKAVQGAIDVPSETARRSFDVLKLLGELAEIGTPTALSDVAVGAQLAQAAIRGAFYNVCVNLDSIADRDAANNTRQEIEALVHQAVTIAERVAARMKL